MNAVLADIGLPSWSGVALVQRSHDRAPSERIVFIWIHPTDRHRQRFGSNVSALAKPSTADDLKRLTQEMCADMTHQARPVDAAKHAVRGHKKAPAGVKPTGVNPPDAVEETSVAGDQMLRRSIWSLPIGSKQCDTRPCRRRGAGYGRDGTTCHELRGRLRHPIAEQLRTLGIGCSFDARRCLGQPVQKAGLTVDLAGTHSQFCITPGEHSAGKIESEHLGSHKTA